MNINNFNNIEEYNKFWIDKAIEDGNIEFLPPYKIPNNLIGTYIENKYKNQNNNKITKKNSLLYQREWLLAAKELGIPIPNRKVCNRNSYSLGELLELSYYRKQINENIENENIDINQILKKSSKKRIKVKLKITKVTQRKMKYYEE